VSVRQRACRAALEIHEAVSAFNRSLPALPLPTRIGLHGGDILLGNVGARHHFEYRAVGDIVNTSSRIEGLNKQLGTRVLATLDVIDGVDDLKVRELGRFRLAGKSTPLEIYELRDDDSATRAFDGDFAAALHAFQAQRWDDAATRFEELLSQRCDDGPTRFYLDLARRYASAPPPSPWDGVVNLTQK
jgi:adenylate cyclase